MKLKNKITTDEETPQPFPVLFIGHGSPMNAIETNSYTQKLAEICRSLPQPKSILVISAHWNTRGTFVTEASQPKTIHDFFGFPKELFEIQYPAPGNPELLKTLQQKIKVTAVQGDQEKWGLDHGTWSILRHVYPEATVPVVQLSLDLNESSQYHFQLGKELAFLRHQGVLILGSGNVVHNLRSIRWEPSAPPLEWALEFDSWVKQKLQARDFTALITDFHSFEAGRKSIPTLEHYLPLFYILGASFAEDDLSFEFEGIQNGSISMMSFRFGNSFFSA